MKKWNQKKGSRAWAKLNFKKEKLDLMGKQERSQFHLEQAMAHEEKMMQMKLDLAKIRASSFNKQ